MTLSYTGIGFVDGDTCPITLDDREHDGNAASQLMRFLGGDPSIQAVDDDSGATVRINQVIREDATTGTRYDPAVGMTGGSYGGQIQFAAAAFERGKGTDRLDAIIPLITWNDLSYSLAPENSALPQNTARSGSVTSARTGVFKYQWAALFTTVGVANGGEDVPSPVDDPAGFQAFVTEGCANFDPPVCQALLEVGTQGYPSQASLQFLRSNSVASYMRQVRVPTLIGQGQADTLFNLQESIATYTALKRQGTPVALVWQSWGHSDSEPPARRAEPAAPGAVAAGPAGAGLVRLLRARHRHPAPAELPVLPGLGLRGDGQHPAGLRDGALLPGRQHADAVPLRPDRAGYGRPPRQQPRHRRPRHHRIRERRADRSRTTPRRRASTRTQGPSSTRRPRPSDSRPTRSPAR